MKILKTSALLWAVSTPAWAIDTCLVGVWQADLTDIAHVIANQMNGQVVGTGGNVSLEITDTGVMTLLANDMTMTLQMPEVPPITVTVTGYSEGAMNADDGRTFVANAPNYNLVGSADVMGQRMEIPVTSATGPWGQATGSYGCSATSISFDPDVPGSIPRSWTRVR